MQQEFIGKSDSLDPGFEAWMNALESDQVFLLEQSVCSGCDGRVYRAVLNAVPAHFQSGTDIITRSLLDLNDSESDEPFLCRAEVGQVLYSLCEIGLVERMENGYRKC